MWFCTLTPPQKEPKFSHSIFRSLSLVETTVHEFKQGDQNWKAYERHCYCTFFSYELKRDNLLDFWGYVTTYTHSMLLNNNPRQNLTVYIRTAIFFFFFFLSIFPTKSFQQCWNNYNCNISTFPRPSPAQPSPVPSLRKRAPMPMVMVTDPRHR